MPVPFVLLLEDKNTKTHSAATLFMQPQRSKGVAQIMQAYYTTSIVIKGLRFSLLCLLQKHHTCN